MSAVLSTPPQRDIEMQMVPLVAEREVHLIFSRRTGPFPADVEPARTDHMVLPAQEALRAAESLADIAFQADTSLKPVGPVLKAELADRHRLTITNKIAAILASYRENKNYSHGQLAKLCAEEAINDIFC